MTTVPAFTTDRSRLRRWPDRIAWISFLVLLPICALLAGLELRRYAWKLSEPIRYTTDIDNAFVQGTQALRVGYIDRYDEERLHPRRWGIIDLDYAPGRLAVATLWSRWVREKVDGPITDPANIPEWNRTFYNRAQRLWFTWSLCRPLMTLNEIGEILSAGAVFVLVFRYATGGKPGRRRVVLGLFGALLFWFNPAVICNAHCWPQWDSWVFPFLLWAIVAASFDSWFTAGVLIGAGAMFKAQILFGLPLFLIWPIVQLRPLKLCRFLTGLITLFAAVTVVWDVRTAGALKTPSGEIITAIPVKNGQPDRNFYRDDSGEFVPGHIIGRAVLWIASVGVAFGGIVALARGPWRWSVRAPIAVAVMGLVLWPFWLEPHPLMWAVLIGVALGSQGVFFFSNRSLPFLFAGFLSTAVLLCIPIFHGSSTWFDCGFARGTSDRPKLASEENENLPNILHMRYGWGVKGDPKGGLMDPAWTLTPGVTANRIDAFLKLVDPNYKRDTSKPIFLPIKYLLLAIWIVTVIPCAVAAAKHHRNRSPRFLIAVVAPWIMLFAVMAQMHQRYLLWGAGLAASCAVISPGLLFLEVLMSVVAVSQEVQGMFDRNDLNYPGADPKFLTIIDKIHPGFGWAILLVAVIYFYLSVRPGRSRNAADIAGH